MNAQTGKQEKPQTEEDITELKWLPRADWSTVLANTFPSIKEVIQAL